MNKYEKMMSRYMSEMNPDIFVETDDPDVYDAVLSPQKIKGFQNYLDRLEKADKAKTKKTGMSDEDVHEAADIAEQIKAELKRMMIAANKDKPKKDEGMLSTKEESTAKEDQIAKGYHQMPDGSVMKDKDHKEEVSTDVAKDLDDEGRGLKGYKPPSEPEKRGYKQDDGGNYSVDSTDDYWQTKEGYKEALDLYGTKPAWVKEPSLMYNPKTKKYDPIEKEEFVDLKPKQDLSAFA
tara:strand:+ start:1993 stop:2700 length:708 start_codon:yes stop_codon:yes gene_type:complete